MDWKSYEMETRVKGKNTRLNSASLWRVARTLMARERVRALGRGRINPGVSALEREADFWKRQREQGKVATFTA
ncbi:MAG TPA: hypothetical protein VJ202_06650 [Thermodesulfobacteriota bacterium]|nr:hypothetical protein [Thermodesulfobacteriota bacterium]